METTPLSLPHSQSLCKIKPIRYRKTKTINTQQSVNKYRVYRFKNLKVINPFQLSLYEAHFPNSQAIRPSKGLEKQGLLPSTSYCLNNRTAFENSYFASRIRNKSASLSSFRLDVFRQIHKKTPRTFFKSLAFLKNLGAFHIYFIDCQFSAKNYLPSLFRCLPYLKNLKHFYLHKFRCKGFEERHLKTLCLSLSRSSQLQSLELSFPDSNQFRELFIPLLSKLTSLIRIHLTIPGDASIQADKILQLFQTLSGIKTLTDLSLNLTSWTMSSKGQSLIEGLQCFNASSIRKLDLHFCKDFPTQIFIKIPEVIEKFASLEVLHLTFPNSQGVANEKLISSMNGLVPSFLPLIFPAFTQDFAHTFKSLQNITSLKLRFENPQLSYHQIKQLAFGLITLKSSLKLLDICFAYQRSFSDLMLRGLAVAIQELTLLKSLSLERFSSSSSFTYKGIEALSLAIQKLPNLCSLKLDLEGIQGIDENALHAIIKALKNLPSLHSLILNLARCMKIDPKDEGLQSLYAIVNEMKSLYYLQLNLPIDCYTLEAIARLKKRFKLRISKTAKNFSIMT